MQKNMATKPPTSYVWWNFLGVWRLNQTLLTYHFTGVGIDVPMFHITQLLGIFLLQKIPEGDVKRIPKKGHLLN